MQQVLINHPKLHVDVRTGAEGPSHDPYSYTEYRVKTPKVELTVHIGLAVFYKVGKERTDATGKDYDRCDEWCDEILVEHTGFTIQQLERFHRKAKSRCPNGGSHELETLRGYPGESFEFCVKCRKYVDSYFCESAVM